ncbi:PqqD family peptide modification chaperone [Emticicia sp. CRIBPO]|uniref:PqqD family peptide modification chaperone n=1 Tax=Emticicia sp. CRIBPO TaxID=2683258 RepID=UPI0014123CCC|nr:PqqD family peptide modification chaperone [Emticicia sp. CRIBPO]NBA88061.1 PqqD family peptide modification chaperone [Emticicia sp. CRIBPO]
METITLLKSDILHRNEEGFLSNKLGDEMVMMNLESGDYLGINEVGFVIWDYLQGPKPVQEILDFLVSEYDVTPENCESDTMPYLQQLLLQKVVLVNR